MTEDETLRKIDEIRQSRAESEGALKELEKQMRGMGYKTIEDLRAAIKKKKASHDKLVAEKEAEKKRLEKEIEQAQLSDDEYED